MRTTGVSRMEGSESPALARQTMLTKPAIWLKGLGAGCVGLLLVAVPTAAVAQFVVNATDDTARVTEQVPAEINVLDNDTIDELVTLHVPSVTANGSILEIVDGTKVRFTSTSDTRTSDEFTYELYRLGRLQDSARVEVTIAGVADPFRWGHIRHAALHGNEGETINIELQNPDQDNVVMHFPPEVNPDDYWFTADVVHKWRSNFLWEFRGNSRYHTQGPVDRGTAWSQSALIHRVTNEGFDGPYSFRLCLNDQRVVTNEDCKAVETVDPGAWLFEVNNEPEFGTFEVADATIGTEVNFTVPASDPDRIYREDGGYDTQTVTFELDGAPSGAMINPTTGEFSMWTPTESDLNPTIFTVVVKDPEGATAWREVSINVPNGAALPAQLARNDWVYADEGVARSFRVNGNDIGIPNDATVLGTSNTPDNGSVTAVGTEFTYTPNRGFTGTDNFGYMLQGNNAVTATVTVVVRPVNHRPVLNMRETALYFREGESIDWTPRGTSDELATDPEGSRLADNELIFDLLGRVPLGLRLRPFTGGFTWQPEENQDGEHVLRFELSDSGNLAAPVHRVTVHILEVNEAPVLSPLGTIFTLPSAPVRFTATATDADLVAGVPQELTFSLDDPPQGATIDPLTGVFTWTPVANVIFPTDVTVVVTDSAGASDEGSVRIRLSTSRTAAEVAAEMVEVEAVADFQTGTEDRAFHIPVLDNDTAPPDTVPVITEAPRIGTASVDGNRIRYAPAHNFVGRETFRYGLLVGTQVRASATVTVDLSPQLPHDDRPYIDVIDNAKLTVLEGSELRAKIVRDEPDGQAFTLTLSGFSGPTIVAGQTNRGEQTSEHFISWRPGENDDGVYTGTIRATTMTGRVGTTEFERSVRIVVAEDNDPPVLTTIGTLTASVSAWTHNVTATDMDRVGGQADTLSFSLEDVPADNPPRISSGTAGASGTATATLSWTPTASSPSPTFVTVVVTDAAGAEDREVVRIDVTGGTSRSGAVAAPDYLAINEGDSSVPVPVLDNDFNYGSSPTLTIAVQAETGTATVGSDGTITYSPESENQIGSDFFSYTLNGTSTAKVYVTIANVDNDPPSIQIPEENRSHTVPEGAIFRWTLESNLTLVSDPDHDWLSNGRATLDLVGGYPVGTIEIEVTEDLEGDFTGVISWHPGEADDGVHYLNLRATDTGGAFDTVTLELTVTEVQSDPTVTLPRNNIVVRQGAVLEFPVTGSDPDLIEGFPDPLTFSLPNAPAGATITTVTSTGARVQLGEFSWDTAMATVGFHRITVRAVDSAGNEGTEDLLVTVRNSIATDRAVAITGPPAAVGVALSAALFGVQVADEELDWKWQRAADAEAGPWDDITGAMAATYDVVAADSGNHLRAEASFEHGGTTQRVHSQPTQLVADTPVTPATDTDRPTVRQLTVTSRPAILPTYGVGDEIAIGVEFTEPVVVTGEPTIELMVGTVTRTVPYSHGSGSVTLHFVYTIVAGDAAPEGVQVSANSLAVGDGVRIRDLADNGATLAHAELSSRERAGTQVDTTQPTISGLTVASDPGTDKTYRPGDQIDLEMTFSEAMYGSGLPALPIMLGNLTRAAELTKLGDVERAMAYSSGTGSERVTFSYVVREGDGVDVALSVAANSLDFTDGTLANLVGNPVRRVHVALTTGENHLVVAEEAEPARAAAVADTANTMEDQPVRIAVLENDTGADPLAIDLNGRAPMNGSVIQQGALVTYTPNPNWSGTDTFTYRLFQFQEMIGEAEVTVMVTAVNDPPTVSVDPSDLIVREGETMTVQVTAQDVDGDSLTYEVQGMGGGSINSSNGLFTWATSEADDGVGTEVFFIVSDMATTVRSRKLRYVVQEVNNHDPVLAPALDALIIAGGLLAFTAEATDMDTELGAPEALTYSIVQHPPGGATIDAVTGAFSWTAPATISGTVRARILVTDTGGKVDDDEITITVTEATAPTAPVAWDDWATATEGGAAVSITVLDNDVNLGAANTVTVDTTSAQGDATVSGQTVMYTPTDDFFGTDRFPYTVSDGADISATGTVRVTVTPVDDDPVLTITADQLQVPEGQPINWLPATGLTPLATDPDGDSLATGTLAFSLAGTSLPSWLTVDPASGRLQGIPGEDQDGEYAIELVLTDSTGRSDRHPMTVWVEEVNQRPVVSTPGVHSAALGATFEYQVSATDADIVGGQAQTLVYAVTPETSERTRLAGVKMDSTSGRLTWTIPANANARERLPIWVTDSAGATSYALLTLEIVGGRAVAPVDIGFVIRPDTAQTYEDQPVRIDVLANDRRSSLPLTLAAGDTAPRHGLVTFHDNMALYTPDADFHGTDSFDYTVFTDTRSVSGSTVTVTVHPVNDPPVFVVPSRPARTVNEGETLTFVAEARDVDSEHLTYEMIAIPAGASYDPATRTVTWQTTETDDGATRAMQFSVSDGIDTAIFSGHEFYVLEVESPPVLDPIGDKTVTLGEELTFMVTFSDSDIIGGVQQTESRTFSFWAPSPPAPPSTNATERHFPDATNGTFRWAVPMSWTQRVNPFWIYVNPGSGQERINVIVTDIPDSEQLQAIEDWLIVPEDTSVEIAVLDNDLHVGDNPTVHLVGGTLPLSGTVTQSGNVFTYTPRTNFTSLGTEFEYVVTSEGESSSAKVVIQIRGINDPPRVDRAHVPETLTFPEHSNIVWATETLGDDPEDSNFASRSTRSPPIVPSLHGDVPEGLTVEVVDPPFDPNTFIRPPKRWEIHWVPGEKDDGEHVIELVLTDPSGASASGLITLNITEVNEPPTVDAMPPRTVIGGETIQFRVPVTDTDLVDGRPQALTYELVSAPHGVQLNGDTGELTWATTASDVGEHAISVKVNDAADVEGTGDVLITVLATTAAHSRLGTVVITGLGAALNTQLTAVLSDLNGGVTGTEWQWQKLSTGATPTWSDISGATQASYTPVAGDVGMQLRAEATYTDSLGPSNVAYSAATAAVSGTTITAPAAPAPDTTRPTVVGIGISSTPEVKRAYKLREWIQVTAVFSEPVNIVGTPTIPITVGANPRTARYSHGSGSPTPIFQYRVQADDVAMQGVSIARDALTLASGVTIKDDANNDAIITHDEVPASRSHRVDPSADEPTTTTITVVTNDPVQGLVDFDVIFSRSVTGFTESDIVFDAGTLDSLELVADTPGTYRVELTGVPERRLNVRIPEGAAVDWFDIPTPGATLSLSVNQPGTVTVTNTTSLLRVTTTLVAALTDPNGGVTNQSWRWQRAAVPPTRRQAPVWRDIVNSNRNTYQPTELDVGLILRAVVVYSDAVDTGQEQASSPTEAILPQDVITTETVGVLDLNQDRKLDEDDALVMYYAFALAELVGDGSVGDGFPGFRTDLLRLTVANLADDEQVRVAIRRALDLRADLFGDINQDKRVTQEDALILYYAIMHTELLGNGVRGGEPNFRETFLGRLNGTGPEPDDDDLRRWLRRANQIDDAL